MAYTHLTTDPGHDHGGLTDTGPFSSGSFGVISFGGSGNDGGTHSHSIPAGTTGITIQTSGSHTHTISGLMFDRRYLAATASRYTISVFCGTHYETVSVSLNSNSRLPLIIYGTKKQRKQ
jgi:hypothetical protein